MTQNGRGFWRHLFGLLLALIATIMIVLAWQYGLDYLSGTPFEELRYVIFGAAVIGLLSVLNSLTLRLMK
ncbi:choline/carnitine O-acyltransferase [Rhizobium laguerreae]|uniref:choline/carnitine O-acyltransferase n=1 Tax=Rhizobium laguerreae TaxID=1076926 RepID=UPI001C9231E3|nr:choline/carnitine O-acyltransferase [Rhizobium laguerreae]MBY3485255.1 choline/carnitine O-acyltransferase [Rhizobium laguerreae]